MAVFSTLQAFGLLAWRDTTTDFLCIELDDGLGSPCFPLVLNDEAFYSDSDTQGWAAAIQAAAVLGIFSCVFGTIAFFLLLSASCFVLKPRRLWTVRILQIVAALFALLTLIAGAADVCKVATGGVAGTTCNVDTVRVRAGAGFMIAGFFLHVAAGITTIWIGRGGGEDSATETETTPLRAAQPGEGPRFTTKILDDGTKEITREYMDEGGNLVRETTIEPAVEEA